MTEREPLIPLHPDNAWVQDGAHYFCAADLKRRGWTPKMLTALGAPDATRPNPINPAFAKMKLWQAEAVFEIEEILGMPLDRFQHVTDGATTS